MTTKDNPPITCPHCKSNVKHICTIKSDDKTYEQHYCTVCDRVITKEAIK